MSRAARAGPSPGAFALAVAAMAAIVVASNVLVRYPVDARIGSLGLADLLTYGAFTYPVTFLVTDLTNRRFGPATARNIVLAGFAVAVVASALLATPRIAVASASAFLVGQLLDVAVFDRLRRSAWWRAPLFSSVAGSVFDTAMFFSLAFASAFALIGPGEPFAAASAPLLGLPGPMEAPRWISWALADLAVKLGFAGLMLAPYRVAARLQGAPVGA